MERRFYIYGSCVSRDAFALTDNNVLDPVGYTARYSMARLNFSEVHNEYDTSLLKSDFQREILKRELNNNLLDDITKANPDFIIIDFIDDRFGLVEIEEGVFVTNSFELRNTKITDATSKVFSAKSENFFSLWTSGIDFFLEYAKNNNFLDRIIINAVFWAKKYDNGLDINNYPNSEFNSQNYIDSFNNLLERQYGYLSDKLNSDQFIFYPKELNVASLNHKWGNAPFHYTNEFYGFFLEKINSISLSHLKYEGFKRWNKKTYLNVSEEEMFNLLPYNDAALYSVDYDSEIVPLDVMFKSFKKENIIEHKKILVSFNGAITKRNQKNNPFFSKMDLSGEISQNLPFIAFSDPSLYLSKNLALAWYNGNYLFTNLVSTIARILDKILLLYPDEDYQIVLCGGSGAGYAILNILNYIDNSDKMSALIWNPQIVLSEYKLGAFKSYLKYCYPNLNPDSYSLKSDLKKLISDNRVSEEVGINIKSKVIVLMNEDDHNHIFKHVSNFIKRLNIKGDYIYGHNYLFLEDNFKVIFGCWGKDHAVPYRSDIKLFLKILLKNEFDKIKEEQTGLVPLHNNKLLTKDDFDNVPDVDWLEMLSITYNEKESDILIRFDIDKYYSIYNLVYYLVHKGVTVKSRWNTKSTKLRFKVHSYPIEDLTVRVYIRDICGNQKIISKNIYLA
ncbi:DUF6270 domain-containing protein [Psychrobacter alimentarius]|uniref:DUF6270 domain-containing protein n=1 Tax=Psychrobacter alimentarius TaxID=261164 RepID=UPI0019195B45|nr:DUF6270 domain-containing protein [Psychrobacter alimentarius]